MKHPGKNWFRIAAALLLFLPAAAWGQKAVSVGVSASGALVSLLSGTAHTVGADGRMLRAVHQGDRVAAGDLIRTGPRSRIELQLPDRSVVRFDEKTTFALTAVSTDRQHESRDISIRMVFGKVWARVHGWFKGTGRFEISTKTAVAGVRGTVYRVNVAEDHTTVIKVYWGEVLVKGLPRDAAAPTPKPGVLAKPSRVLGPQPIEGPKPVTMKEWTYIVRAMQQITVRPDGTAEKPFSFSPEEDRSDWVDWNRERDAGLTE